MRAQQRVEKHRWLWPWLRVSDSGSASGWSRDGLTLDLDKLVSIARTVTREVCKQAKMDQTEILRARGTREHSKEWKSTDGFGRG
jgi:hypothetical protein